MIMKGLRFITINFLCGQEYFVWPVWPGTSVPDSLVNKLAEGPDFY